MKIYGRRTDGVKKSERFERFPIHVLKSHCHGKWTTWKTRWQIPIVQIITNGWQGRQIPSEKREKLDCLPCFEGPNPSRGHVRYAGTYGRRKQTGRKKHVSCRRIYLDDNAAQLVAIGRHVEENFWQTHLAGRRFRFGGIWRHKSESSDEWLFWNGAAVKLPAGQQTERGGRHCGWRRPVFEVMWPYRRYRNVQREWKRDNDCAPHRQRRWRRRQHCRPVPSRWRRTFGRRSFRSYGKRRTWTFSRNPATSGVTLYYARGDLSRNTSFFQLLWGLLLLLLEWQIVFTVGTKINNEI